VLANSTQGAGSVRHRGERQTRGGWSLRLYTRSPTASNLKAMLVRRSIASNLLLALFGDDVRNLLCGRSGCQRAHYRRPGLLRHTVHVSTEAKLTHKRYGINSSAAKRLVRQKTMTVATMSASRTKTSTAAAPPRCQAKNNHDQSALAASCAPNKASASLLEPSDRHTSQPATPIHAYSADHTGPNTAAGGAQGGLLSCA